MLGFFLTSLCMLLFIQRSFDQPHPAAIPTSMSNRMKCDAQQIDGEGVTRHRVIDVHAPEGLSNALVGLHNSPSGHSPQFLCDPPCRLRLRISVTVSLLANPPTGVFAETHQQEIFFQIAWVVEISSLSGIDPINRVIIAIAVVNTEFEPQPEMRADTG